MTPIPAIYMYNFPMLHVLVMFYQFLTKSCEIGDRPLYLARGSNQRPLGYDPKALPTELTGRTEMNCSI